METRKLTLEVNGTIHQIKTALLESAKLVEYWETTRPEDDQWWSKTQSGSFYSSLNVKKEENSC